MDSSGSGMSYHRNIPRWKSISSIFPDWPASAGFSPDGKSIVVVSDCQIARIWDAGSGRPVTGAIRTGDLIQAAVFTPGGKGLMTVAGSTVQIREAETGNPLTEPMRNETLVKQAIISRFGGRWIMTAAGEGTARIWDAQTGKAVSQPLDSRGYTPFMWAFSPDAKWGYARSVMGAAAWLWDGLTVADEGASVLGSRTWLGGGVRPGGLAARNAGIVPTWIPRL